MTEKNSLLRQLPKVDDVIRKLSEDSPGVPMVLIKKAVQKEIGLLRQKVLSGEICQFQQDDLIHRIKIELNKQNEPHLKKVVNATGVVLHTNLGRAKLSRPVSASLMDIGLSYSNLEYDLENGTRGLRYDHVEELLTFLTGAEAALVVNNNAAAVYLILDSVTKGKEVIVSRGELVEIGGSFRVPEIMKAGGCKLVEVGTTNKTHERDYIENIREETGALLKVHTSNYKIIGFTEEVPLLQLREIGAKYELPVIYDLGSGLLLDLSSYGIGEEPTVGKCLEEKADIVCFSGDKLLGGPQAGMIVGKKKYIDKMKKNHLLRALRIDKLTLAALEQTLRLYLSPDEAMKQIPTLKMITEPTESLKLKAEAFYGMLEKRKGTSYEIIPTEAQAGGGTLPGLILPSYAVGAEIKELPADRLEQRLREHSVPIIARIWKDKVLLDVRTMEQEDMEAAADFFNNYNLKGDTQ